MYDRNLGYLDQALIQKMRDIQVDDLRIQSMIEQVMAWYYRNNDLSARNNNYKQHLEKSIMFDPTTVKPYIDLGNYYLSRKEEQAGKDLIKKGLKNIIRVCWRIRELDDISSLNEFFEINFRGIYVNPDYYASLQKVIGRIILDE